MAAQSRLHSTPNRQKHPPRMTEIGQGRFGLPARAAETGAAK